MKTLKSIIIAIAMGSLFPNFAIAQAPSCSYFVQNSTDCAVSGTIEYYDDCSSSAACSTVPFTLGAQSNTTTVCSGCGTLCNIVVTVLSIGGGTPSPNSCDINTSMIINAGVTGSPCTSIMGMQWAYNNIDIHY